MSQIPKPQEVHSRILPCDIWPDDSELHKTELWKASRARSLAILEKISLKSSVLIFLQWRSPRSVRTAPFAESYF